MDILAMLSTPCVLCVALIAMCTTAIAQQQSEKKNLELGIRERNTTWNTAFNNRDTTKLFSLFSAQSILTTAGGRWVGAPRCKALMKALFKNRPDITWINSAEKIEVLKSWDVAYETGTWTEAWTSSGREKSEIIGRYWIMYNYDNGAWFIHSSIFTPLSCAGSYCN